LANFCSTDIICRLYEGLPFYLPLIVSILVCLINYFWKSEDHDIFIYLGSAGLIGSIVLFWRLWVGVDDVYFLTFAVTKFGLFLSILISFFSLLVLFSALNYYSEKNLSPSHFVSYLLFATFGLILSVSTHNLIAVLLGVIITSIFVGFMFQYYSEGKILRKLWYYFLIVDFLFSFGLVLLYGATGSFEFQSKGALLVLINDVHTASYFRIGITLISIGLFAKIGIFPIHWWINDAIRTRSFPVLSFILVFYRVGMLLLTLKILAPIVSLWGSFLSTPIFILAILTILWGNLIAVRTKELKSLISASSVASLGYVLLLFPAMAVKDSGAEISIIILSVGYFLTYLGLIISIQFLGGDSETLDFSVLDGLGKRKLSLSLMIAFFMLSAAGIPPLVGFLGRAMMLKDLAFGSYYVPLVVVLINFAMMVYYFTRPLVRMYLGGNTDKVLQVEDLEFSSFTVITTCILLSILLGLFPNTLISWIALSI